MSEYKFHEYPKWVKNAEGVDLIVNSSEEEEQATGVSKDVDTDSVQGSEAKATVKRGRPAKAE